MENNAPSSVQCLEDYVRELTRPARILLIEDEPDYVEIFESLTDDYNREIVAARTGMRGIELYSLDTFDIVFLDIKLPDIPGTEVFNRLKATGKDSPIVVISGYLDRDTIQDVLKSGFAAFVQKPENFNRTFISDLFRTFRIQKLSKK